MIPSFLKRKRRSPTATATATTTWSTQTWTVIPFALLALVGKMSIALQLPVSSTTSSRSNSNNNNLIQYTSYWDQLLLEEYREQVEELKDRRKTWSRERLIASGLSIFNAAAEPESELFGDKIVRIYVSKNVQGGQRLRDKFNRGDVLLMTPTSVDSSGSFSSSARASSGNVLPRECLVVDVGNDWLTAGVGPSWPKGLFEARKLPGSYRVRLDRTVPRAPLKAQRQALSRLSRDKAGSAAALLANLDQWRDNPSLIKQYTSKLVSDNLNHTIFGDATISQRKKRLNQAMVEAQAVRGTRFRPNQSQALAIAWALQRRISLIRGPPGTGKTRAAAALISTYLKLQTLEHSPGNNNHRVLAVTHSNGAADVLLQALLHLGVPAVRLGRPASVSPMVQHRTVVAMSEKLPHVTKLRQVALNPELHQQTRSAAVFDMKQYMQEAQQTIIENAPVIVTSCIGAHQLMSSTDDDDDDDQGEESSCRDPVKFSLVVCDESGQTTEPSLVCALAAAQAEQVVLVGDTQQLPPTVTTSNPELRDTLGRSPMARLERLGVGQITLRTQYRMPKALLEHPSRYFYRNLVRCSGNARELPPPAGFAWPKKDIPLAFVDTKGPDNELVHNFGGRSNPTEATLIAQITSDLLKGGDLTAQNISIITPYAKQVQLIRAELANTMIRRTPSRASREEEEEEVDDDSIRVGTVDSFQGQETGVVLFSAVRSNSMNELGFLRDKRRLNDAITRARRGLVIVGDAKALQSCRHWDALISSCENRGCLVDSSDAFPASDSTLSVNMSTLLSETKRNPSVEEALDELLGVGSSKSASEDEDDDLYGLWSTKSKL